MNIFIEPRFRGRDSGEGGIRRVVEAQRKWLPEYGFNIVDDLHVADLAATHAGNLIDPPVTKPWVCHMHGLYWEGYQWPAWCHRLNREVIEAMRRSDHVTAPSEWVAQTLRRGMWLRPTVLHHGVDPDEWTGGTPGEYVYWNKNRADPVCDPRVVDSLAEMATNVQFITTFGSKRPNIKVLGRISFGEAKEYMKNAGIYLATTRETFGIGTLEAMAAGVPVVGWAWGGQREIIKHGLTGWLVPPGDVKGLLEGIRWGLANRDEIAAKARFDIDDRWTWKVAISRYAALYKDLIEWFSIMRPKVSVVVPCYNLAKELPDAIASLQAQTMDDWEAIIVDDASPDDTQEVASKLAEDDPRVRVIRNETNLYLAGSLNAGISEANGRYILPLDADNMISPTTLGILSDALDADRGIHIAYGSCQFVLPDGKTPDTSISANGVSAWPTEFSFRGQMIHRNQIPSTCMYRRTVWERSGGYRRRCRTAEDAEFWTRVSSLGFWPKKVTNAVTLIYRQRPGSMSRVEEDWDWTAWFPWSRDMSIVPFGAAGDPPASMGLSWPVPTFENPNISVIIPVGPGHEELLIDALDSLEAQTLRSWEAIVVNDTGQRLDIPHSWATVLTTQGQEGPAKARNLGISHAKAPAFLPLDADDFLQPEALASFYKVWLDEEGRSVVYSQWWDAKESGTEIYDPVEYDAKELISNGCIHAVTALYPKAAWELTGGFDEAMANWEDWDFQLALAEKGICGVKVSAPLWTYRKMTGTRRREHFDEKERGKVAILAKWGRYWEGEELMACRGCPGRSSAPPRGPARAPARAPVMPADVNIPANSGAVLLEFLGEGGARTYKGPVTHTKYRFGSDPSHRQKYVLRPDAQHLLHLGGEPGSPTCLFRIVHDGEKEAAVAMPPSPSERPILDPLGPPTRTEEISHPTEITPGDLDTVTTAGELPPDYAPSTNGSDDLPSIKRLEQLIPDLDKERIATLLAQEKAGPQRVTAIRMLERALTG